MTPTIQPKLLDSRAIFITGTDTHVGKTVVTTAIGLALKKLGLRTGIMKPVETGIKVTDGEFQADSSRLHRLLAVEAPYEWVTPYQFLDPVAPLAASRKVNQPIDFELIKNRYQQLSSECDFFFVEGAGGVMVPLTEQETVLGLIEFLQVPCIVVCRSILGAVNHCLLTLEALRHRKIPILAIVLNHVMDPSTSETEQLQISSTVQLIREFSKVPVLGPVAFEPLILKNWEQGVNKLADDPAITQLIKTLQKSD